MPPGHHFAQVDGPCVGYLADDLSGWFSSGPLWVVWVESAGAFEFTISAVALLVELVLVLLAPWAATPCVGC